MQISTISVVIEFMSLGYLKAVAGPTLYGTVMVRISISIWRRALITGRTVRRQAMALSSLRSVYQTKRISRKVVKSKKTSIGRIADSSVDVHIKATRRLSIKSTFEKDDRWLDDTELSPIPRCDSPIALWPCEGFCKPSDVELPHVVRIVSRCLHE